MTVTAGDTELSGRGGTARAIVYLVTEDWYFLSHRLPMALAAQRAGYRVHVATRVSGRGAQIEAHGFTLHPLDWRRGSLNPAAILSIIRQVRALYRRIRPDLAHHVALQPSVIGSLAALGLPLRRLNALAGLGFVFTSRSAKALAMRPVLTALLRLLLGAEGASALVQNPDDRAALERIGVPAGRIALIPGSGMDTDIAQPLPEPAGEITIGFVGRLLEDKGLCALMAAHELMAQRGAPVRLLIAGDRDPANPASIAESEIARWKARPAVELLGHVGDIGQVWARAHIAVLPSRREGLPKSLLEAAAFGRPIVATDVPGCREIARHGVNAFLVPADDPVALAGALALLAREPEIRLRFGAAGRRLVEEEFSGRRIGEETVQLYDRLLDRDARLLPPAPAAS